MSPSQWSRTAFGLALLFGSLPVASRILLGEWAFEGAGGLGCLWAAFGLYLLIRDRRTFRAVPDPAAMLDQANQLAAAGRLDRATARLTVAIKLSPRFWQAYQYRGQLSLRQQRLDAALRDFDTAIELAPHEPHLYELRAEAHLLLGDEASSARDFERANALRV
jgi:tetratricopeptide (TPR) repeat protein